jgi:hypothetical protein
MLRPPKLPGVADELETARHVTMQARMGLFRNLDNLVLQAASGGLEADNFSGL